MGNNPFADAWGYMEWIDNNCCHCRKYDPEAPFEETACEIERDISMIPFTGASARPSTSGRRRDRCGRTT